MWAWKIGPGRVGDRLPCRVPRRKIDPGSASGFDAGDDVVVAALLGMEADSLTALEADQELPVPDAKFHRHRAHPQRVDRAVLQEHPPVFRIDLDNFAMRHGHHRSGARRRGRPGWGHLCVRGGRKHEGDRRQKVSAKQMHGVFKV